MNNELQQYDNIDLNKKGLPNIDNNSIGKNIICDNNSNFISPKDILYSSYSAPTIRTIEISDTKSTNDKDSVICKVCGRRLKDHHSRALGMGPQCYKQFKASKRKMFNLLSRRGG